MILSEKAVGAGFVGKPLKIDYLGVIIYGKLRLASGPAHLVGILITVASWNAAVAAVATTCPLVFTMMNK